MQKQPDIQGGCREEHIGKVGKSGAQRAQKTVYDTQNAA